MRHIVRTREFDAVIVDDCESLEEALERLKLYRSQAYPDEVYHIGYDHVALNLEDWEEEWIAICQENDKEQRTALAEYRRNGGVYFEGFKDELDIIDDYEPTDEELRSDINEDFFYEY